MKVRLPRVPGGTAPEAVLINTAGGLTGGDVISFASEVRPGAEGVLTTQACERVYKATTGDAHVTTKLAIGDGARMAWLPQETILFDGGRLKRSLDVDMAAGSTFLAVETVIFGRAAMGETVQTGRMIDQWRIRVGGRLLHAEALRLSGDLGLNLTRPAALSAMRVMSTVLLVADGAPERLEDVRGFLEEFRNDAQRIGVSALPGRLVVRAVAADSMTLRGTLQPLLRCLQDGRELPRVWAT